MQATNRGTKRNSQRIVAQPPASTRYTLVKHQPRVIVPTTQQQQIANRNTLRRGNINQPISNDIGIKSIRNPISQDTKIPIIPIRKSVKLPVDFQSSKPNSNEISINPVYQSRLYFESGSTFNSIDPKLRFPIESSHLTTSLNQLSRSTATLSQHPIVDRYYRLLLKSNQSIDNLSAFHIALLFSRISDFINDRYQKSVAILHWDNDEKQDLSIFIKQQTGISPTLIPISSSIVSNLNDFSTVYRDIDLTDEFNKLCSEKFIYQYPANGNLVFFDIIFAIDIFGYQGLEFLDDKLLDQLSNIMPRNAILLLTVPVVDNEEHKSITIEGVHFYSLVDLMAKFSMSDQFQLWGKSDVDYDFFFENPDNDGLQCLQGFTVATAIFGLIKK